MRRAAYHADTSRGEFVRRSLLPSRVTLHTETVRWEVEHAYAFLIFAG
jgi:hypothetical protein